jgi:hypothetical protein
LRIKLVPGQKLLRMLDQRHLHQGQHGRIDGPDLAVQRIIGQRLQLQRAHVVHLQAQAVCAVAGYHLHTFLLQMLDQPAHIACIGHLQSGAGE